jgi:hypothetical protein
MFAIAKALMIALTLTSVAGTGAAMGFMHMPSQKAIDIHKSHLGLNTTMPEQSQNGQQNSLDHLLGNQDRQLSNHNVTHLPDTNETELPESD